jgi:SpoVK/Ycf46/Vps4 family AAA+-type ATPase
MGESEKQVGAIFEAARNVVIEDSSAMAIIFMDEAEGIMLSRNISTLSNETINAVKLLVLMKLTQLDDFNKEQEAAGKSGRVLFIAATNYPGNLDDAFLRRFERRVFVDLPDVESRKDQIRMGLLAPPFNLNLSLLELECLGHMTNTFSPSDIQQTLKSAQSVLPDLTLESSSYFRLNERGKYEIVPLINPELPPCSACSVMVYDKQCPKCKCIYMQVLKIPVQLLETTVFISIADVIDVFAKQRSSLNQDAYDKLKAWHATRGST